MELVICVILIIGGFLLMVLAATDPNQFICLPLFATGALGMTAGMYGVPMLRDHTLLVGGLASVLALGLGYFLASRTSDHHPIRFPRDYN